MTTVETIGWIRRAYFVRRQSVHEIARRLHVSRKTFRKAIEAEDGKFSSDRVVQPKPKLGGHIAELERLLAENERKLSEIATVSGALTLLTNIVMACINGVQQAIDASPVHYPPEHLARIAPVAFRHINMHGKLYFPIGKHGYPRLDATSYPEWHSNLLN